MTRRGAELNPSRGRILETVQSSKVTGDEPTQKKSERRLARVLKKKQEKKNIHAHSLDQFIPINTHKKHQRTGREVGSGRPLRRRQKDADLCEEPSTGCVGSGREAITARPRPRAAAAASEPDVPDLSSTRPRRGRLPLLTRPPEPRQRTKSQETGKDATEAGVLGVRG